MACLNDLVKLLPQVLAEFCYIDKLHKIFSYFSEEYDIEELKAVYDSFTLGDLTTMQTGENPLKLALVNNNSSC